MAIKSPSGVVLTDNGLELSRSSHRQEGAKLLIVQLLSSLNCIGKRVSGSPDGPFCQSVSPGASLGCQSPLCARLLHLGADVSPVRHVGCLDEVGSMISLNEAGSPKNPDKKMMGGHEHLGRQPRARLQADCLGGHADVCDDPALETSSTLCRVLDHKRPKQIQGEGLERGQLLDSDVVELAHKLLLVLLVNGPTRVALICHLLCCSGSTHNPNNSSMPGPGDSCGGHVGELFAELIRREVQMASKWAAPWSPVVLLASPS